MIMLAKLRFVDLLQMYRHADNVVLEFQYDAAEVNIVSVRLKPQLQFHFKSYSLNKQFHMSIADLYTIILVMYIRHQQCCFLLYVCGLIN